MTLMKLSATKIHLLIVFILTTFFNCNQVTPTEPNIEKAITDLTDKFSQLPKGKSKQSDYYRLVRSVTNGEKNFQIQLRSTPDSIEDPQKIIIFINSSGQHHAIPFFSNTHRDFWEFQFDTPIPSIKRTNTTFAKELMTALDTLHFNDTLGTANIVIDELLFSILNCRRIKESDSTDLFTIFMNDNHDIPEESSDSGFARLRKNYTAISSQFHPHKYINNYNAYFDENNHRVYQFDHKETYWKEKLNLSIKVYRQDYVYHSFTL